MSAPSAAGIELQASAGGESHPPSSLQVDEKGPYMNQLAISPVLLCTGAALTYSISQPCFAQSQPWPPPYAVFELSPLGGEHSQGWDVSERGDVIGGAFLPSNVFHATVWRDGQSPIDLGTLGGELSECRGINSNGWIVGKAQAPGQTGYDNSAFLWRNGQMINLGYLADGDFSEAYGINDLNQIVGWSSLDTSSFPVYRAFIWQNGVMSELPITGEFRSSEAIAINNAGLIVGQASSWEHGWRPVVWENGQIIDLGTFRPDNGGVGICIDCNELNDVVGYTAREDYFTYQAFIYRDGVVEPLPEKRRWRNSYAWSINDSREIVGACRVVEQFGNEDIGCIWQWQQPPQYLHDLIPPKSNWFIGSAIHNNDAGQITGTGVRVDNPDYTKGYLLTPVHPTMELSEPSPGLVNADNTLTVTGATPGSRVTFIYSRHGGGTAIPGCTLQTNCLQLDAPKIIGRVTADENGTASVTAFVPRIATGETVLIQAFVRSECAISQLVVHQFE